MRVLALNSSRFQAKTLGFLLVKARPKECMPTKRVGASADGSAGAPNPRRSLRVPTNDQPKTGSRDQKARLLRLLKRDDMRQASALTGGTMIAQVATIALTPVLTRIYGADQFAELGLLMSIATVMGSVAALCYEQAILHPRSARKARALFGLSMQLCAALTIVTFAVMLGLGAWGPAGMRALLTPLFSAACCVAMFAVTVFNAVGFVNARLGQYREQGVSKINQSILPAAAQIGLGAVGAQSWGLTVGRAIGVLVTNIVLQRSLPRGWTLRQALLSPWREVRVVARDYRDYILHVPRQLFMRIATSAPPVLLLAGFGAGPAGLFFFAQRLVERPGVMLGDSLSRVPMKQVSTRRAAGKPLVGWVLAYTGICAAIVGLSSAAIFIAAGPLVPIIFGQEWAAATPYIQIMTLWAGVRLSVLPMTSLVASLRLQKLTVWIDGFFALRILAFPIMAAQGASALSAIVAYCTLSVVYDLTVFMIGLNGALRHDRALAKDGAQ